MKYMPLFIIITILVSKLQSTNCRTHYFNQKNSRTHYHKPAKGRIYHNHHDTINHISLPPFPSPLPSPPLSSPPIPSSPSPSSKNPTNSPPFLPPSHFLSPSPLPSSSNLPPCPSYDNSNSSISTSTNSTSCDPYPRFPSPSPLPSPSPFPSPSHPPSPSPLISPTLPSPNYDNSISSNSTSKNPSNSSPAIVIHTPLAAPSPSYDNSISSNPTTPNNHNNSSTSTPDLFYPPPSPSPSLKNTSNNYTYSLPPSISYDNSTSCNSNSTSPSPLPLLSPSPSSSPSPSPSSSYNNSTSSNPSTKTNNSSTNVMFYPPSPSPSSPFVVYYNSTASPSPSFGYDNSTSCNSSSSYPALAPSPLPSISLSPSPLPSPSPSYNNNSTSSNTTSKSPASSPTPMISHPPLPNSPSLPPPTSNNSASTNPNNCTTSIIFNIKSFGAIGNGSSDDTKAIRSAWKLACVVENAVLLVPDGVFIITSTIFTGPCQPGFVFQIDGVLMPPDGPDCWPNTDSKKQWIVFYRADNMTLQGEGTIEGNGENWWNLPCKPHRGPNGSTLPGPCDSPALIRFFMSNNVTVTGLRIENSPQFHIKFDGCNGVHIDNMWINSPSFSPNTDGIHIENTKSVQIYNSRISNGDDCISIGAGCADAHIENVTCGPGHGISIGSLGVQNSHACVSNITVRNVRIHDSDNGVRIKTWQGGSGSVSGIIFDTIVMENVRNCINIDQYYCMANKQCKNQTSAIYVTDVSYNNIKGTYNIKSPPVHFACSDTVPCSNITMSEVELLPSEGETMEGPFCWNAYGNLATLTIPPVYCLQEGRPQSLQESLVTGC